MQTKTKLNAFLTTGIILALGPLWGFLGTIIAMIMAYGHMGKDGMGKPELLADDIGVALYTTAIGLIVCPIGIACIIISCIKLNRMKKDKENPDPNMEPIVPTHAA